MREVDIKLEAGAISESVSVEVPAVSVKTIGGDVSGIITGAQVRELPLNGRNFLQLALLMPGVNATDNVNVKDKGLLGGSDISVSGSAVTSNLWTVDGANNNDVGSNRTILVYPSLEAIEEFKVQRSSYSAEFGQASGGQINIITRGGTNEFHGGAFYFGRNDALNSTNYFLKQANQPKDKLSRHDFGWNVGGPIIKDKLHFFASQEWNKEKRGTARSAFVPTAAERHGDFSGARHRRLHAAGADRPGDRRRVPRQQDPGRPAERRRPRVPAALPAAERDAGRRQLQQLGRPRSPRRSTGARRTSALDWTISNTTRVMARYTQDSWTNNAPSVNTQPVGRRPVPGRRLELGPAGQVADGPAEPQHRLEGRQLDLLLVLRQQDHHRPRRRHAEPERPDPAGDAVDLPALGRSSTATRPATRVFWGGGGYSALWNEAPFRNNQDLYVLKDDYSAVFGKHLFKAGLPAPARTPRTRTRTATARRRTRRSGARPASTAGARTPATSSATSCSRT